MWRLWWWWTVPAGKWSEDQKKMLWPIVGFFLVVFFLLYGPEILLSRWMGVSDRTAAVAALFIIQPIAMFASHAICFYLWPDAMKRVHESAKSSQHARQRQAKPAGSERRGILRARSAIVWTMGGVVLLLLLAKPFLPPDWRDLVFPAMTIAGIAGFVSILICNKIMYETCFPGPPK